YSFSRFRQVTSTAVTSLFVSASIHKGIRNRTKTSASSR
uniref:Transposase n=1 Tax=Ascaris lumbricoides TaxID=6252 RepID=A0A0M3IUQ4_ASCLU